MPVPSSYPNANATEIVSKEEQRIVKSSSLIGDHLDSSIFGGKGANLAEMAHIGLSVPPGLTVSTEACDECCVVLLIDPVDLEDVLASHPAILDAAVTGVGDEEPGELPAGFVVMKPGAEAS
ncbi:hypothetical protein L1987_06185 [Smallanthus sonchifolius]|uniref:Uncharacterized protein n=1 Tax=Smallanthus sonchifolius TaxID=185202 RepID=A0ACB9JXE6_9ASTR|nr:hypothetical protein L1987_06185 [Smallanthus sonchifolius]